MKRLFLTGVLVACLLLSGCSFHGLMDKVPNHAFSKFEYHRGGNFSSTHITAKNAIKIDNEMIIESLVLTSDYGPFANFTIILEDYSVEE